MLSHSFLPLTAQLFDLRGILEQSDQRRRAFLYRVDEVTPNPIRHLKDDTPRSARHDRRFFLEGLGDNQPEAFPDRLLNNDGR